MSKQKSSNSGAFRAFVLTLVILILAVAVTAAMTQGFTNWNPYGWFDELNAEKTDAPEADAPEADTPETDEQEDKSSLIASVANSGNIKLAAVSSAENDSVVVTATVKPETASDKSVDWNIAFANPSSEWANGKNTGDYISFDVSGTDNTIATISCLQAFGEPITLTATSNANPEAKATVILNYARRVSSFTITSTYNGSNFGDSSIINTISSGTNVTTFDLPVAKIAGYSDNYMSGWSSNLDYDFGVGTINPEFDGCKLEIKYSTELVNAATSAGYSIEQGWELVTSNYSDFSPYSLFTIQGGGMTYPFCPTAGKFNEMIGLLAAAEGNLGQLKVSFETSVEDKIFTSEFTVKIMFSAEDLGLLAQSVEVSSSSIIF